MGFKIFNNLAPGYLKQHFHRFEPSTGINLRQVGRDPFMFRTERQDHKDKTKNLISGIKVEWNNLPLNMRKEESLVAFKIKLKTYLFKIAYN